MSERRVRIIVAKKKRASESPPISPSRSSTV